MHSCICQTTMLALWYSLPCTNFLSLLTHPHTQTQALEASLAEACQLGPESDWRRDVPQRLQQVDVEQERKTERLAVLHRQALAEEAKLAAGMRDVAGRKVRKTPWFVCWYIPQYISLFMQSCRCIAYGLFSHLIYIYYKKTSKSIKRTLHWWLQTWNISDHFSV